jgi:hypothetical protein
MLTNIDLSTAVRSGMNPRRLAKILGVLSAALFMMVAAFATSAQAQYYHGRYGYHGGYYGGGHYRGYYGGYRGGYYGGGYYGHRYGYYGGRYGYYGHRYGDYGGRYGYYGHRYGYYGGYGPRYYGGYYRPRYYGGYYGPAYSGYGPSYYDGGYQYADYYYSRPSVYDYGPGDPGGYCAERFASWDPESRTYLGFDGFAHTCP